MNDDNKTLSETDKKNIEIFLTSITTREANLHVLADILGVKIPKTKEFECKDFVIAQINGEKVNFYDDFRDMYFGVLTDEDKKNEPELKSAEFIISELFQALKKADSVRLRKICGTLYDAKLKMNDGYFVESEKMLAFISEHIEKEDFKVFQVCQHIITTTRKGRAEFLADKHINWADLKKAINDIIYCTIYKTINELKKKNIDVSNLENIFSLQVPFSEYWFSTTCSIEKSEKTRCVRGLFHDEVENWPEYESNSLMILDCAAFIQEILFYNRYCYVNQEEYKKENFNIWNQFSGLALGLGELYAKYKNGLPLDDNEIIKNIRKLKVFTSGKSPKYSEEDQKKIADELEQEYLKSKKPSDKGKKSDTYYSSAAESSGYGQDTLREVWKKYYPERFK